MLPEIKRRVARHKKCQVARADTWNKEKPRGTVETTWKLTSCLFIDSHVIQYYQSTSLKHANNSDSIAYVKNCISANISYYYQNISIAYGVQKTLAGSSVGISIR
jgi:hypothetical protein